MAVTCKIEAECFYQTFVQLENEVIQNRQLRQHAKRWQYFLKKQEMNFPNIDYSFWHKNWNESIGNGNVYTNKHMKKYIQFDGDINKCTEEIINLTKSPNLNKENILRVIDLIYSWGGKSGRLFYFCSKNEISPREKLESNEQVFNTYKKGIELAKHGNAKCIDVFKNLKGIGPSYASKHSYFWSLSSESPLIIVDSKIAGALGYKTIDLLQKEFNYDKTVKSFVEKAQIEFNELNPSKVERALFAFHNFYFLNDNSDWKFITNRSVMEELYCLIPIPILLVSYQQEM